MKRARHDASWGLILKVIDTHSNKQKSILFLSRLVRDKLIPFEEKRVISRLIKKVLNIQT